MSLFRIYASSNNNFGVDHNFEFTVFLYMSNFNAP